MNKTSDEEHEFPARLPPGLLFRSFLLVASAYVIHTLLLYAAAIGLLVLAFPESFEILCAEPEQFDRMLAEDPDRVYPRPLLWMVLGCITIVCVGLGYAVARLAPIAKFPHAILLAAILFVNYLLSAIDATDTLQRMLVLFMAASPIATVIGANLYLRQRSLHNQDQRSANDR